MSLMQERKRQLKVNITKQLTALKHLTGESAEVENIINLVNGVK